MKRTSLIPLVLLFLIGTSSCFNDTPYTRGKLPASAKYLIVPGQSVGNLKVGALRDSVIRLLGTPMKSDTAPDKILDTWALGKDSAQDKLSVYYNLDQRITIPNARVRSIQVTDSNYRTQEGVGPGDSILNLSRIFIVRPTDVFHSQGLKYISYGTQRGMTFVINPKGVCNSVIIYNPKVDIDSGAYKPYFAK